MKVAVRLPGVRRRGRDRVVDPRAPSRAGGPDDRDADGMTLRRIQTIWRAGLDHLVVHWAIRHVETTLREFSSLGCRSKSQQVREPRSAPS